jgi:type IX secretion system PorP/SprF family membrane protein
MKKHLLLVVAFGLSFALSSSAQQIFRRTQFPINTYLANPAVAGTQTYSPIFLSYRTQWAGFKGAPTSAMASGHTNWKNGIGLGGVIYNDDTGGLINRTGIEGTAAYHVELTQEDAASFGLSLSAMQLKLANSGAKVYDPTDITLNGMVDEKLTRLDASFGFLLYGKQYYAGFSIPQLFRTKQKFAQALDEQLNRNWRHFQFMGSYRHYLGDKWDIQPSAFIRLTKATPAQIDLNVRVNYLNYAFAGLTYRHRDALAIMIGGTYEDMTLVYSYDFTTTNARQLSPFTHELTVGYYIQRKGKSFAAGKLGPRKLGRSKLVN